MEALIALCHPTRGALPGNDAKKPHGWSADLSFFGGCIWCATCWSPVVGDTQMPHPDGGEPAKEDMVSGAIAFSREGQHALEAPGSLLPSTPSTPRLTPPATSRSSLSDALSPPGGSSPRTPSTYSLERAPSRAQRSYSTMSSGEGSAPSMTPQQLTRAYARQESVSRVLAFARDGLQTAVRETSELKRKEIARQVHAQILREQLHQGSSSVWSSQDDMSVGSNCFATSVTSLPQFRYAASHNADLRNSSRIGKAMSSSRQSPRLLTKRSDSNGPGADPQKPCRETTGESSCFFFLSPAHMLVSCSKVGGRL